MLASAKDDAHSVGQVKNDSSQSLPELATAARARPRITQIALALVVSVVGTLALCELVLRLLWHNPYRFESGDHLIKLALHHPNTDHIFSRALVVPESPRGRLSTDHRSYIRPSFQYQDPDATVAFLGGSTTECAAVQEDLRFPALVSTLLAKHGLQVNTLNAARSGNTTHDSLNVLLNHVSYDHPDIVVMMHASNDIGILVRHGDYRSRSGDAVSLAALGKWAMQIASGNVYLAGLLRHSATSSIIRHQDPSLDWRNDVSLFENLPSDLFRRRLKAFVHLSRDLGIQPVLMTQPFSGSTNSLTPRWIDRTAQDGFNTIIREIGKEEQIPVIDLVRYLQESVPQWDKPLEIFYDAIHVTDKGSSVYAQHIADRLIPLVLQISSRNKVASSRSSTAVAPQ
jgi:lysophospholipase L1-like esterase